MTKKIIIGLIAVIAVLYFLPSITLLAQSIPGLGQPFGGRIIVKYPCSCSLNSQIFIGPPRGGSFTSDVGTIVYKEYNLNIPAWTLGLADAYEPCLQTSIIGPCFPIGPGGSRIRMVGTSGF